MKQTEEKIIPSLIEDLVFLSRDLMKDKRGSLQYQEDEIGITSLLQCPIKVEMRKKYPDIKGTAPAIDDGFRFETITKMAARKKYGENVVEEMDLPYQFSNLPLKIRGHLDLVIFKKETNQILGIELKAPQIVLLKKLPENLQQEFIFDSEKEENYIIPNPIYKIQAKIEKFILQKMYPESEVRVVLFQNSLCKFGTFTKKFYTIYEVESIQEAELNYLATEFLYNKAPRFKNECEYYCQYNEVCDYKHSFLEEKSIVFADLDNFDSPSPNIKEFIKIYKEYLALKDQLKRIEKILQKTINGSIVIGGREIGWVERIKEKYDIEKIIDFCMQKNIPIEEYLHVTTSPLKRKRIKELLPEAIISEEKEKVFKL